MDAERWNRLQGLFAQALSLGQAQREDFVRRSCGADEAMAAELAGLLAGEAAGIDGAQAAIARAAAGWAGAQRAGRIAQRVGPWRIVSHLADGGMGAVYLGERADGRYQQRVAIKLLNPSLASTEAGARLALERQILARLAHPHIARLLDGGDTDDGVPYLVMEYVDGVPIDKWCRERAPDLRTRLELFVQVCRAVDHAHRNLVVHRDLKPANILVDADGTPRLLDFGIAKLTEAGAGVTASGERLLTPTHASPEQVTGRAITTATDIYALGVLLYEMLTGRLPHEQVGGSATALARAIVETEPMRPSLAARAGGAAHRDARLTPARLARALAGDLDNIVLTALRKEPERRYASAAALAEDVQRHLARRPVLARPDTMAYRSAMFWRRHPVAVPVTAGTLVLALVAGGFLTWRLADERDRAVAAERSMRRSAEFATSLLAGTSAARGGERSISVLDLLDTAAARIDKELADEPEVAARLRAGVAAAFNSWGAHEKALRLIESALPVLRARKPVPHVAIGEMLDTLFVTTHDLGRYEEALQWARQAEEAFRLGGDREQHARALNFVAVALTDLRRTDEAVVAMRAALHTIRGYFPGDHVETAYNLSSLGLALHFQGRLAEARKHLEEALAMQQRLRVNRLELGQTRMHLGMLHWDLGDIDRAAALWRQGGEDYESVYGRLNDFGAALAASLQARADSERGRHDQAVALSAKALQACIRLLGAEHRRTAELERNHAQVLQRAGQPEAARALFERSLATSRAILPPLHTDLTRPMLHLAQIAEQQGRREEAERRLREALSILDALPSTERTPRDDVEWLLARLLAARGDVETGRALAVQVLGRMRAALPPTHHRLVALEAALLLPPLAGPATPETARKAREALERLRGLLGPQAPAVQELMELLRAAEATADD